MDNRMDGWMDWWVLRIVSETLMSYWEMWAAGQPLGSNWWWPWVETQVTWLQVLHHLQPLFPLSPAWLLSQLHSFINFLSSPGALECSVSLWTLQSTLWMKCCPSWHTMRWNPPLLGVQSRAWVGAGADFLSVDSTLWAPSLLGANFPLGSELLPAPLPQPGLREKVNRGPAWVEITGSLLEPLTIRMDCQQEF